MTADLEHEAKVRAMERVMAGELRDVTRIGAAIPTLTDVVPVRIEKCFVCGGDGWVETSINSDGIGQGHECRYCNGRGVIATDNGEA